MNSTLSSTVDIISTASSSEDDIVSTTLISTDGIITTALASADDIVSTTLISTDDIVTPTTLASTDDIVTTIGTYDATSLLSSTLASMTTTFFKNDSFDLVETISPIDGVNLTARILSEVLNTTLANTTGEPVTFDNISSIALSNITEGHTRHQFPKDMLGFTAACAFIIAILGASGNLLTIFALPMCKKLRNTTATAFVVNLALVELLFCVIILPMSGAQYAYLQYHDESLLSNYDCNFFVLGRYTFTQVQLQTIVGIALTRAVAVGLPSFFQKINSNKVIITYIVLIWLYSFFLKLPAALGIFGSFTFNKKTMECDMGVDPASIAARKINIYTEVLTPVTAIIVLYIFIFVMVKKSSMRVRRASLKNTKTPLSAVSSITEDPSSEDAENGLKGRKGSVASFKSLISRASVKARFTRRSSSISHCMNTNRRDLRVARTIFIVFIVSVGCSVPVGVIHFIDSAGTQPRRFLAVHIIYWLQYCLNVVVYVLLNRQYRDAYVDFIAKLLPSWARHRGFTFPWEAPSVTSTKPLGPISSFRSKKDSASSTDPNPTKRHSPASELQYQRHGRLSAIPEVNSSSIVSNSDDVFIDNKRENDQNDNNKPKDLVPETKIHLEEGTNEEKQQLWVNQNGQHTTHLSESEDKL